MRSEAPAQLICSTRNKVHIIKYYLFSPQNSSSLKYTSARRTSKHYLGTFKPVKQKFLASLPRCNVSLHLPATFSVFSVCHLFSEVTFLFIIDFFAL